MNRIDQWANSVFTTTTEQLVQISMACLAIAFLIRIIYKDTGFEYLKLLCAVPFLAFSLFFSIEAYKIDQIYKHEERILSIKLSNLGLDDKNTYIEQINHEIKQIKEIQHQNIIFSWAKILLYGLTFIYIWDTLFETIRNYRAKMILKV